MSWPVYSLPDISVLKEQLKTKKWIDFYKKIDYFTGSEESITLISNIRNGKNNIQLVETEQET
jgi:hypothetical protein